MEFQYPSGKDGSCCQSDMAVALHSLRFWARKKNAMAARTTGKGTLRSWHRLLLCLEAFTEAQEDQSKSAWFTFWASHKQVVSTSISTTIFEVDVPVGVPAPWKGTITRTLSNIHFFTLSWKTSEMFFMAQDPDSIGLDVMIDMIRSCLSEHDLAWVSFCITCARLLQYTSTRLSAQQHIILLFFRTKPRFLVFVWQYDTGCPLFMSRVFQVVDCYVKQLHHSAAHRMRTGHPSQKVLCGIGGIVVYRCQLPSPMISIITANPLCACGYCIVCPVWYTSLDFSISSDMCSLFGIHQLLGQLLIVVFSCLLSRLSLTVQQVKHMGKLRISFWQKLLESATGLDIFGHLAASGYTMVYLD